MRLLKGFIFALTGLFIMITLVSLLIPSTVVVTRGVEVHAEHKKVFNELIELKNWKHWHPVFHSDSSGLHFSTDSISINSYCEWISNGRSNKLVITALTDDAVTIALQRQGENEVINTITILPLADSNSLQVEWRAVTRLKWYPWEKFYGIFIEKVTGQGYESALNGLKVYSEGH